MGRPAADPTGAVVAALRADPAVRAVTLVGSRAAGDPTPLSDWDYVIASPDPAGVAARLPSLVAALRPLAARWDPLAHHPVYLLVLAGPPPTAAIKVDVFPGLPPREPDERPPAVTARTLPAIDAHFWDWNLWLASKRLRGRDALVRRELDRMWRYILAPLGAAVPPATQPAAIATYHDLRRRHEQMYGVAVPPDACAAVTATLAAFGLLPAPEAAPGRLPR